MIYLIKREECIVMIRNLGIIESYKLMIFFWILDYIVQEDSKQMNKKYIIKTDNYKKKLKIIIEMTLNRSFKLWLQRSKLLRLKSLIKMQIPYQSLYKTNIIWSITRDLIQLKIYCNMVIVKFIQLRDKDPIFNRLPLTNHRKKHLNIILEM